MSYQERASETAEKCDLATDRGALRRYESPRLVRYGELRNLTLGPTPGIGESGDPYNLQA